MQIENSGIIKTREMCAMQQHAKKAYDKREIKSKDAKLVTQTLKCRKKLEGNAKM